MRKNFIFFIFILSFISFFQVCDIAYSSDHPKKPKELEWNFNGMTGKFDKQSIQRGFQVYKEVCSACHAIKRISFRNLLDIGFSEKELKSLSSQYEIKDGPNNEGEMYDRKAKINDGIPGPFANEQAARASNNGAYPLDLSLITKARHDGANYVYSLLTGYEKPPSNIHLPENMYYNEYFSAGGNQLAMTPPIHTEGQVEYSDGTKATVDQMAKDVVNFLQWTAEPEMEESKSLGVKVMIFFVIFIAIFYIAMKRTWKNIK
ncbi:MAG: ubiquinol-cytochrome c reductase cytochrome c1 subunit [Candidatus Midichloriaceae bacterium]|jgi:ubiquinol-cytochrome c reductase cytochrome c1 subunit